LLVFHLGDVDGFSIRAAETEVAGHGARKVVCDREAKQSDSIDTRGRGLVNSGNLVFGGFGQDSNIWFFRGVSYTGQTNGTVNSVSGSVAAVATANGPATGTALISSGFRAKLVKTGRTLPVASFRGTGRGTIISATGETPESFRFSVFGTRVSTQILFGS
jgi:hypothetical protein